VVDRLTEYSFLVMVHALWAIVLAFFFFFLTVRDAECDGFLSPGEISILRLVYSEACLEWVFFLYFLTYIQVCRLPIYSNETPSTRDFSTYLSDIESRV
jgi:hypothetical protein